MREEKDVQISHQTGATFSALLFHTIELTPRLRQAMNVQIIKRHVPAFHAWKCHDRGTRTITAPRMARMGYAGYVGSEDGRLSMAIQTDGLEGARRGDCSGPLHDGRK